MCAKCVLAELSSLAAATTHYSNPACFGLLPFELAQGTAAFINNSKTAWQVGKVGMEAVAEEVLQSVRVSQTINRNLCR